MDEIEQLWIRACKSSNPIKRIKTLYKRFYYVVGDEDNVKRSMISILSSIHDKYCEIETLKMLDDISKDGLRWRFSNEPYDYREAVLKYLINKIRLTEIEKLPGLTPPRRFR